MEKLSVSRRGQNVIASPIRKFLPLMQAAEAKGVKVFKLNVGDPDLTPPSQFLQTIKKYNAPTLGYAPSPGIKAHMLAWQTYYKQFGVNLQPNQMLPTVGCAEAIMLAMQAVADFGDEIIVFEPLYTSYKSFAVMAGIKLMPITLSIEKNFAMPPIPIIEKKITGRTKAIVIINPDNPTGKLWSQSELKALVKLAKKHKLFIISDETYREIRFSGKPYCLLQDKSARQNVILTDSVSKRFSMPGARIGCVSSFNPEVMAAILKFAQARLSAGTLEQLGLVPLLSNSAPYVNKVVVEYKRRQKVVAEGLKQIKGAVYKPAQGAFYQAVKLPINDSEEFVKFMVGKFRFKGKTVMVTPMKDFYITSGKGRQEIRIACVLNIKDLKEAMDVLGRGVEAYNKSK
jgi:aspartate aminotransferase